MGSAKDLKGDGRARMHREALGGAASDCNMPANRRLSLKPRVFGPEPRNRGPRMPVEPRYDRAETSETWVDEGDWPPGAQTLILAGDSYILVP